MFPTFWGLFDDCVANGVVIASREVLSELEVKADDLFAWAKARGGMFHEIDDAVQSHVTRIMARHPKLVDERRNKSAGDPWVIALAAARSLTVVTEESAGKADRPTIPYVCQAEEVRCINLLGLIRELNWRI